MKSEISTFTLINLNIEEAIAQLLEAGWTEIEVMCEGHGHEMLSWDDEKLNKMKSLLESHRASLNFHAPITAFNPASIDPEVQLETADTWKQCMRLIRFFNSRYILFHPGRSNDVELGIHRIQSFFSDRINDLPNHAMLILENVPPYEGDLGVNSQQLLQIGSRLPAERWGVFFDTGHSHLYDRERILAELEALLPVIKGFHFNDNHGEKDEHLAIGEGTIPFEDLISIIKDQAESYYINYEMNSIEDAKRSFNLIEHWLHP